MVRIINGDACHDYLSRHTRQALAFNDGTDYKVWREKIRDKFSELTGFDDVLRASAECEPLFLIESDEKKDGYRQVVFSFYCEEEAVVPCSLLIPDTGKKKYPVAVTLQGHTNGFPLEFDEATACDCNPLFNQNSAAIQAVNLGFAALSIEQRALGSRNTFKELRNIGNPCEFTSYRAMMCGRTIIAERVADVIRAIDMLSNFVECDTDRILITGDSDGGTTAYYSACVDERIKLCVPVSSFCSYADSILDPYHCSSSFIPGAFKWFDMQDLSCLIAPRKICVVSDKNDKLFPFTGVEKAYSVLEKIYAASGATTNCRLASFRHDDKCKDKLVWKEIMRAVGEMGWPTEEKI